jgi:glycine/D-amino acid oxidase-like deaminating enzyme
VRQAGRPLAAEFDRRAFLKSAAAAAATLALPGCRASVSVQPSPEPAAGCLVHPVRVSPDREIRTIAGLRPFRPSGFVVRSETLGETVVIHNYGHGGAGITLSWGTAKLAVDLVPPGHRGSVGVIGCGAVGLATARLLQERGHAVTIYAKDLPPNTTSNVAGGQWFPFFVFDDERRTPELIAQLVTAAEFAYRRYQILVGSRYGVRWIRNYTFARHRPPDDSLLGLQSPLRHLIPELRDLAAAEHRFPALPFVRQFDTMLIEPPVYLAAMLADVRAAGGEVRVMELADRDAVRRLSERVVVNCSGLGAKALFGDEELVPIKGQLTFLLPQPEVDYVVLNRELYMFPRSDGILLGGTHERGVWTLEPNLEAKSRILAGHREFFESFRAC